MQVSFGGIIVLLCFSVRIHMYVDMKIYVCGYIYMCEHACVDYFSYLLLPIVTYSYIQLHLVP